MRCYIVAYTSSTLDQGKHKTNLCCTISRTYMRDWEGPGGKRSILRPLRSFKLQHTLGLHDIYTAAAKNQGLVSLASASHKHMLVPHLDPSHGDILHIPCMLVR